MPLTDKADGYNIILREHRVFYKVNNVAEMNDKVFVHSVNTIMISATSGKGREIAEK